MYEPMCVILHLSFDLVPYCLCTVHDMTIFSRDIFSIEILFASRLHVLFSHFHKISSPSFYLKSVCL